MKKAKPSKGSARTKKFDAGGLAALAGLGTLAYLMRKKKGEEKESEGSAPKDKSGYSSGPVDVRKMIEGSRDDDSRTPSSTKFGGESNLGTSVTETGTRPGPDTTAPENKPAPAPKPAPKKRPTSQTFPLTKPAKEKPSGIKTLSEDSSEAKAMRESRKQRLGTAYAKQYSEYQSAPEGAGKEALKKSMEQAKRDYEASPMKKGGKVKKYASGGSVGSASKRADGIAQKGKTRGRIC
jgi:hypothetical protein